MNHQDCNIVVFLVRSVCGFMRDLAIDNASTSRSMDKVYGDRQDPLIQFERKTACRFVNKPHWFLPKWEGQQPVSLYGIQLSL